MRRMERLWRATNLGDMTSEEQHELETISKLLATEQGETLVAYLKRKAGFDLPVFDAAHDFDDRRARMIDGGRQLIIALMNTPSEWRNISKLKK